MSLLICFNAAHIKKFSISPVTSGKSFTTSFTVDKACFGIIVIISANGAPLVFFLMAKNTSRYGSFSGVRTCKTSKSSL